MFDYIDGANKSTSASIDTSTIPIKKKANVFDYIDNEYRVTDEADNRNVVDSIANIGPGTIADNASMWDAFTYGAKLGFTDTIRGVTQMAGGEKVIGMDQSLEDQQKELYERFQDEDFGTWAKIGYFGGAILDPITWLIPIAKAKGVVQMAQYGAMSGGLFGALGYVDKENPLIDTRTKQAAFGALAGSIISPVIGTAIGQTRKLFGKEVDGIADVIVKEEIKVGDKIVINSKGDTAKVMRIPSSAKDNNVPYKVGETVRVNSKGDTGTIIGFNKKNITMGNTNDSYIIKMTGKKFESRKNEMISRELLESHNTQNKYTLRKIGTRLEKDFDMDKQTIVSYNQKYNKNAKALNDSEFSKIRVESGFGEAPRYFKQRTDKAAIDRDLRDPVELKDAYTTKEKALGPLRLFFKDYLADPIRKPFNKIADAYQEKGLVGTSLGGVPGKDLRASLGGKPGYEYLTTGKYGTEIATGTVGAVIGPQALDEEATFTQKFSAASAGFITGALGIKAIKHIPMKRKMFEGTDSEKEVNSTLGELLARGIRDDYGLPTDVKIWKNDSHSTTNMLADKYVDLAVKVQRLPKDERAILMNMVEGDMIYKQSELKSFKNVSKKFRQITKELGQQYVDNDYMSAKAFQRNLDSYMRRNYLKDAALGKVGDELKARGIQVTIPKKAFLDIYKKDFAFRVDQGSDPAAVKEFSKIRLQEPGRVGSKEYKAIVNKLIKGSRVKGHRGWEIFDVSEEIHKILTVEEKAILTSGNTTSAAFKKIFKKIKNGDSITLRWELTKQERIALGQIEDLGLGIAETGRILSTQLGRLNFYTAISKSKYVYDKPTRQQITELKLVRVPTTVVDETLGKRVFGSLAGKYLFPEIADNIFRTHKYATNRPSEFYKKYRILNQTWKVSKTAFNPTVHVNNSLSNIILYDTMGGNNMGVNLITAHRAIMASSRGQKSQLYTLAKNHSVLNADLLTNELKDISKYLKANPYSAFKADGDPAVQSVSAATILFNDIKRTWLGSKTAAEAATKLYQYEDQVFRIALFKDRLEKGWNVGDAARDARRSFIDYDINAPLINWMRQYPTPFLAYSYRVVPLLAEAAVVRPWKFAKWAALGYGLNGLGQYVAGGDQEAERAGMSENKQGDVFGIGFMPKTNIKMPATDKDGKSMYIDIKRFVPGGDVLDLGSAFGGKFKGLPSAVQPTFGAAGDVIPALFGYDLFNGEKLKGLGGSGVSDWRIRINKAFENITPNFPFFPGSYTTQNMEKAQRGVESPFRVPETELFALIKGMGLKINIADLNVLGAVKSLELSRKIKSEEEQIQVLSSRLRNRDINEKEFELKVDKIIKRIQEIGERYSIKFDKISSPRDIKPFDLKESLKAY